MIRLGRWQDVMADVATCDAVICDPPYGDRTHATALGARREDGCALENLGPQYAAWTAGDVAEFVASWSPRCSRWMVALTCSDLLCDWRRILEDAGRYVFAPVPCVMRGMSVRLAGDGPSSWAVYAIVARPRSKEMATWGALPGAYVGAPGREAGGGRGKPDWLMRALVRDYSRRGDLIVDPFAGWAATGMAAMGLDRRFLGAEVDPDAHAEGMRRLGRGQQADLFASTGAA